MSLNLYMRTNAFKSNRGMAEYFHKAFAERGFAPEAPEKEEYMYSIASTIDGESVTFYMGKNDEESSPALWQIWPEQKLPLLKKLFGTPDRRSEEKAKLVLEEIVKEIQGVEGVEWAI